VAHTMKVFYGNQSVSYAEIVRGTERETEYFPAALPASFSLGDHPKAAIRYHLKTGHRE